MKGKEKMIYPQNPQQKELAEQRIALNYDSLYWKEEYGPYFRTILLFLTGNCNLNCPKCFNRENMASKNDMDFDFIKKLVLNNSTVDKYDIMGGEPLLHPQINDILYFLDGLDKKIGLYTNGLLLDKVPQNIKNLKINMAFHSIDSQNPSDKPISKIIQKINIISQTYPLKIVYLMTQKNKNNLFEFVDYVENNIPRLKKITIGQIRDELNYYNDAAENVIPLQEYAQILNHFIQTYKGRLNVDIFSEGILETPNFPHSQPYQLNRFRSVFPDHKYVDCLYEVAISKKNDFDIEKPLPFPDYSKCPITGRSRCITDKIKLKHISSR